MPNIIIISKNHLWKNKQTKKTTIYVSEFIFFKKKKKKENTSKKSNICIDGLPGVQATHPEFGNLGDIPQHGGSLHSYLVDLHKTHGEIAAFYWMKERVVSLASSNTWKTNLKLFDRPISLFSLFMPLIGETSIQYANGKSGKDRRRGYIDFVFAHSSINTLFSKFIDSTNFWKQTEKLVGEDGKEQETTISLHNSMLNFALQTILSTSLGINPKNTSEVQEIQDAYNFVWHDMEQRVDGSFPDTERQAKFDKNLSFLQNKSKEIIKNRAKLHETHEIKEDSFIFIDYLWKAYNEKKLVEERTLSDETITFLVGGFHTTGNLLAWALYFLAKNPQVLKKVHEEIDKNNPNLSVENPLLFEDIPKYSYFENVIHETLRLSVLAPWAARYSEEPCVINGYVVPEKTPMIHALGVVLQDKAVWGESVDQFIPERFEIPEIASQRLAFSPFGFAGGRVCPGKKFAMYESLSFLITILKSHTIRFKNSELEKREVKKVHGLVTSIDEEIEIVFTPRSW